MTPTQNAIETIRACLGNTFPERIEIAKMAADALERSRVVGVLDAWDEAHPEREAFFACDLPARRAARTPLTPQPIFSVTRDTCVLHVGKLAGQWRWVRLVGDKRKHWWCERTWFV